MGIILFPLLVKFSLIYRTWTFRLSMLLAPGANELGSRFRLVPGARAFHWAYLFLGLGEWACAPIFKPYQLPSSPYVRRACARALSFLESNATSTCLLRAGLVKALSPSYVL